MRVLLVEDEPEVALMIKTLLGRDGHMVEIAADGDQGLWMASEFEFDVVVLDWTLPEKDGLTVCRQLREVDAWMPVLMLTGRRGVEERVAGLRAGADDYLTKPFAGSELVARLEALVRRTPRERPTILRAGSLSLDPGSRQVRRGEADIVLRPREHALLELLMRRAGEALGRAEILSEVWDAHFDSASNVVDSHIKSLRNKVDKPFGCSSIETVRGVGYRLNPE